MYLFLEELDNSVFKLAEVDSGPFFVVVGGRQGVFRETTDDLWQQDTDPDLNVSAVDDPLGVVLTVNKDELESASQGQ